MKKNKLVPKSRLYLKLHSFENGGDIIYLGKLPFDEIIVYPSLELQREAAARRAEKATKSYRNWNTAVDMDSNTRLSALDKDNPHDLWGWIAHFTRPKTADCINTATHWITNGLTISKNSSLYSSPESYGFLRIDNPQRGDLIQYIEPTFNYPTHAGVVLSRDASGTTVRSSNGTGEINPVRKYDANGKATSGAASDMNIDNAVYYRYTYPKSGVYFKINGEEVKM